MDTNAQNMINGHEYVDLGLPSGVKWATCNLGANSPSQNGNYYGWGELICRRTIVSKMFSKNRSKKNKGSWYITK